MLHAPQYIKFTTKNLTFTTFRTRIGLPWLSDENVLEIFKTLFQKGLEQGAGQSPAAFFGVGWWIPKSQPDN
jgi:hypothetical protein